MSLNNWWYQQKLTLDNWKYTFSILRIILLKGTLLLLCSMFIWCVNYYILQMIFNQDKRWNLVEYAKAFLSHFPNISWRRQMLKHLISLFVKYRAFRRVIRITFWYAFVYFVNHGVCKDNIFRMKDISQIYNEGNFNTKQSLLVLSTNFTNDCS